MNSTMAVTPLSLPILPSNYFFRVRPGAFHIDRLELRRKFLFFSIRVNQMILVVYALGETGRRSFIYVPKSQIEYHAADLWNSYSHGKINGYAMVPDAVDVVSIEDAEESLQELEDIADQQYRAYYGDHR